MNSNAQNKALPSLIKISGWHVLLGLCIASTVAGCGTILTIELGPTTCVNYPSMPPPPLPRTYSGTITEFRALRSLDHPSRDLSFVIVLMMIDVPLSLIADTLILPLTIYEQNKYGDYDYVACPHTY